jgi:holo-[acyl-carrier protein] synthase
MIIGVGIDVVHISRMERWRQIPGLLDRFFHSDEIKEAARRGRTEVHSLAARFAAKEAFGKALGTGMRGLRLRSIKVENDKNGKPTIVPEGRVKELLQKAGGRRTHVSLTHESDNAIAVVVIEGD